MHWKYLFTVFTPTYNRANEIDETFKSLNCQNFQDFEWIIVDDGSVDDTENVIKIIKEKAEFPIRYFWQKNRGKHRARNFAVSEAEGELFLTLDSGDKLFPDALSLFEYHWHRIPNRIRKEFAGITGLCADSNKNVVGSTFPKNVFTSDMIEIRDKYAVTGEKCGFQRTDIMKEFPFPEIEGEKFIPEGIVWRRIAEKYKTLYVNNLMRLYEPSQGGLSSNWLKLMINNPKGFSMSWNEQAATALSSWNLIKASANYGRCSFHNGLKPSQIIQKAKRPIFSILMLPLATFLYAIDKWQYSKTIY